VSNLIKDETREECIRFFESVKVFKPEPREECINTLRVVSRPFPRLPPHIYEINFSQPESAYSGSTFQSQSQSRWKNFDRGPAKFFYARPAWKQINRSLPKKISSGSGWI